jgi:ABC-2 type transport system ATP-binding protein
LWWDLPAIETFNLNKEIYEIPDKPYHDTLNKLVELLEVQEVLNVQVRKLSLGQRMKCELIAALLHNPKVLFLDEPTIGLDVVMQKVMRDFIKEYNCEFKSTVILTSHYMDDVKELCKRVIMIDKGQVMFDGLLQDVINKYARNKILTVVFSEEVDPQKLKDIGEIKDSNPPEVKILVPRKEAAARAAKLLQSFPVEDINIEEPPIEAIIREVFSGKPS